MIVETFLSLGAWGWIVAAAILLAAEIVVPGYFLIWLGAAAAATGAIFLVFPGAGWQAQTAVFGVLAAAALVGWFRFMRGQGEAASDQPLLNRRPQGLIGREFVLDEPIQAGRGRVRLGDTVWLVAGPDVPAGTRVRVGAVDGATLVVERA